MFMKDSGKMIKRMGKEYTIIMMALAIMDSGSKMFNRDSVFKNGQTGLLTRGN